jgi:hypothetical protein
MENILLNFLIFFRLKVISPLPNKYYFYAQLADYEERSKK